LPACTRSVRCPAVTIGLATARRFPWTDTIAYITTQVVAAIAATGALWFIAINQKGQTATALASEGLGSNGYELHSPAQFNLTAALVAERLWRTTP
jgi:aquaporin Z